MIKYNPDTTQFDIFYNGMYIDSARNYLEADERLQEMLIHCDIKFDETTKEWILRANGIVITRNTDKNVVNKAREEYIKNSYSTMLKGK